MTERACTKCGVVYSRGKGHWAAATFACRKFCSKNCRDAASMRPVDPRLLPGERVQPACKDCIPCDCPATFEVTGIPCVHVGRSATTDRCLECGRRWLIRAYRWEPSVEVHAEVAA